MTFAASSTPLSLPIGPAPRPAALRRLPLVELAAVALLTAAAFGASPARAQSLLIDGFDAPSPPSVSVLTGVNEATFNNFTPTVPGGVRGVYHHPYTNPLDSVAELAVGNGALSSSTGMDARSEILVYYGAFTRPTLDPDVGGPRLGLDATPYNAFRLDFSGACSYLNINIVLYTANPTDPGAPLYYSTVGDNYFPAVPGGAMSVVLPFQLGDAFNFAQVDGIALIIDRANNSTNVSFNLDSFSLVSTVPEPSPVVLLASGVGLMGWLLRRQRLRGEGPTGHLDRR
jgi:hypothetical protein